MTSFTNRDKTGQKHGDVILIPEGWAHTRTAARAKHSVIKNM